MVWHEFESTKHQGLSPSGLWQPTWAVPFQNHSGLRHEHPACVTFKPNTDTASGTVGATVTAGATGPTEVTSTAGAIGATGAIGTIGAITVGSVVGANGLTSAIPDCPGAVPVCSGAGATCDAMGATASEVGVAPTPPVVPAGTAAPVPGVVYGSPVLDTVGTGSKTGNWSVLLVEVPGEVAGPDKLAKGLVPAVLGMASPVVVGF